MTEVMVVVNSELYKTCAAQLDTVKSPLVNILGFLKSQIPIPAAQCQSSECNITSAK